jgi:hypothetical protein
MKPHALLFSSNSVAYFRNPGVHRVATYLREHGWDVEVCDFTPFWKEDELQEFVRSRVTSSTKFFGFGVFFNFWSESMDRLTLFLKKQWPNIPTVLGGQSAGLTPANNIDYWVDSYGEVAMLELAKSFVGNSSAGLKFDFNQLGQRKVIKSLHSYPAYPLDSYKILYEKSDFVQPWEWSTMEFARGCKFQCAYCNYPILGVRGDNSRSAQDFELQMRHNYDNFGISRYWVADETFNDRTEKITKFADVVEQLDFEPFFSAFLRVDLLATQPEQLEQLARMRVGGHFYGVETFNHASAKIVGKGMHPDRIKQTLLDTKEYLNKHIFYRGTVSLIAGLPLESPETFLNGQQWLLDNWDDQAATCWALELENWDNSQITHNQTNLSKMSQNLIKYGIRKMDATHDILKSLNEAGYNWKDMGYTPDKLTWEHDHMNIFQAVELADKFQNYSIGRFKTGNWDLYVHDYNVHQSVDLINTAKSTNIMSLKINWGDQRLKNLYVQQKLNYVPPKSPINLSKRG